MGVANSPDIFQQKMNDLFHVFESFLLYMDDILILTTGDWKDHIQKLELTLNNCDTCQRTKQSNKNMVNYQLSYLRKFHGINSV